MRDERRNEMRQRRSFAVTLGAAAVLLIALLIGSSSAIAGSAFPRSGELHVTKECSVFAGQAGGFCTITSSNVKAIPVGSKVIYKDAAGASVLDTDVVLYAGPGNSAFGHVILDLSTGYGTVTFDGGTGQFTHFHATQVDVTPLGWPNWAWDGSYSFSPSD
jgi:hypothetical protein